METDDDSQRVLPFQLQFDKPVPSQVKIAEWNPEKDLLAMVMEDSKILLHRFNWQRLWTISPGRCITSLCWRPDGKAIAVGLEDGTISLHDVENGKLLRSMKSHLVAVVCLNWEEDRQGDCNNIAAYEDRTTRFFPPPPRAPRMPGLVSGDGGLMDENEDSFRELSNSSHQRFNILSSGDKDGSICFSIFGIFPVAKINIHNFSNRVLHMGNQALYRLQNASIYKVSLSKDLCHLTVICSGETVEETVDQIDERSSMHGLLGMHCLVLNTSIFWERKNELHQVAQQASCIEDLAEVIRASLSVMHKQWSDAMQTFHQKFDSLSTLIIDHGLDSSPQEEFLSLLGGARTSPPLHQFLVNSLGEVGVKRVSKIVCNAGKELQGIVLDHLQPAVEVIGFRVGELRGLSKWRARYQGIGLDETLINNATEEAGIFLVQVERFMRVLSSVVQQFSNFFSWLHKCIKLLMSEPSDQLLPFNSELVVIFLKFLYDQDPVKLLLEISKSEYSIEVDLETIQRVGELVHFGGFSDTEYMRRSLAREFQQMEACFKEAFLMPFTTISKKIICEDLLPLFPFHCMPISVPLVIPTSISHYKEVSEDGSIYDTCKNRFIDYISFRIPDDSFSGLENCIGIAREFVQNKNSIKEGYSSIGAVILCLPNGYTCVDLSLYKESQIVLLLNETATSSEGCGNACMMIVEVSGIPFKSVSRPCNSSQWLLHELKDSVVHLQMENEKVRSISHPVIAPLAVSASRGVACVFALRKRALVYILDEDEDEASDVE